MYCSRIKIFSKRNLSIFLNFMIFALSFSGFLISCLNAKGEGYYHWITRLLYFTQQSNLWIGIASLIFAIMLIKKDTQYAYLKTASVFKYVFTVSITLTGIIFCSFLAPFAGYNVWTFASVLTHVVVPVLSVVDFFTNREITEIDKKHTWLTLIPPFLYFIFTSVLCILKIDFGKGEPYPYFFMDYYSEVGLFGFVGEWPPKIGSFYWMVFIFALVYLLGAVYYKIKAAFRLKSENNK